MRLGLGLGLGIGQASGIASGSGGLILPNLLTKTELFDNANWLKSASLTVTPDTTTDPLGGTTADTITVGAVSNQFIYDSVTVLASTQYTFSLYVQLGTLSAANYKIAMYDGTALAFIASNVVPSPAPVAGSWRRIAYAFTTPVGCTTLRAFAFSNTATVSGTVFLWGAMLNTGSLPATYAAVA